MKRRFDSFPYMLLIPAFLLTAIIVAWPLFETFRLSFTNASLRPGEKYVGFENYVEIFEDDFWEVMSRTFVWMFIGVSLKMIMGLIGAVLLNAALPGARCSGCWSCRHGSCLLRLASSCGRGCITGSSG